MQDETTSNREQYDIRHPAHQGKGYSLVVSEADGTRIAHHGGLEPAEPSRHHGKEVHQIGEYKQGTELIETEMHLREEPEEQPWADEQGDR
jgi:hypothetical protein